MLQCSQKGILLFVDFIKDIEHTYGSKCCKTVENQDLNLKDFTCLSAILIIINSRGPNQEHCSAFKL